jgi:SAM-dependent methyltransferase
LVGTFDRSVGRNVFGRDPALYDRARPRYPEQVFDVIRERCGLRPGTAVLEIGPGPGLATRRLLELGASPLVAVEPNQALAGYLAESTQGAVTIVQAPFEEADLPDSSFDLGMAASSFHWVDSAVGLEKVRRLLRPGGWWAMWWNVHGGQNPEDAFHLATLQLLEPLEGQPWNRDRPYASDVRDRIADLRTADFENAEAELIRWRKRFDTAGIRDLYSTFSPIARLPDAEREALLDAVADVAAREFGGVVDRPMLTPLYTARRAD